MKLAAILALGIMSSMPLQAQDTAQPAPKPEKKICRQIVPVGTIMAKRFCLTKSEWAELRARTEADADGLMQQRRAGMCGGGDGSGACGNGPIATP